MAAIIRHGWPKTAEHFSFSQIVRNLATKKDKRDRDRKIGPKIESEAASIAAKGFLRPQNPYNPPENVESKLKTLCTNTFGEYNKNMQLKDLSKKYSFLVSCTSEFNHEIPNSLLHTMETVQDVLDFYTTSVTTTVPLDAMRSMNLPENLHVQYDYVRFHPDDDTMFNGVSAFPKSSTLVTGLKYKGKYKGHEAKQSWPYS